MENKPFPFKKIFWAHAFIIIPITLLSCLLALFDIVPIDFNNTPRYGFEGFIIPILFLPLTLFLPSGGTWLFLNIGNWLHEKFLNLTKEENN